MRTDPPVAPGRVVAATRRALLSWFSRSARELPWRAGRDPWRVWVSEVMLQQTRVEAVVEPFQRFLEAFPSLAALARSDESQVLAHWSGLGYYRRARMLHAGARFVVARHGGEIPRTRDALEKVPGIGSYTAGALLSIAFGKREPALDANVTRVVSRLGAVVASATSRATIKRVAAALVDCTRPGDVNEALMDLGSAICTAREARCGSCPLARMCLGHASGQPLAFAPPRVRKPPRRVELACAVVSDEDRVLFLQRSGSDALLGGLWDLPTLEIDRDSHAAAVAVALRKLVRDRSGIDACVHGPLATARHEIVGRKITANVYVATARGTAARRFPPGARMLGAADRSGVGMPALPVRILALLARADFTPARPPDVAADPPASGRTAAARGAA